MKISQYPLLTVDLNKIYENTRIVVENSRRMGIDIAGVIKGYNGIYKVNRIFVEAGCKQLATSR